MKNKINRTTTQNFCVMVVCIWALSPPLAFSEAARLLSLAAVCVWILIEASRPRNIFLALTLPVLLMIVFSVYTIAFELLTHGISGVINRIQLYIMLFFLLAQQAHRNSMESLYPVFWLVIALNLVWMTSTLIFVSTVDARVMRSIVRSTIETQELSGEGVGGYAMAYGAVLLLPVLTLLSLRSNLIGQLNPPRLLKAFPLLPKLAIWYLTATCIFLVVVSQFTIALLAAVVVLIATLVLWKLSNLRCFVAVFSVILLVFFGKITLIDFLVILREFADGTNYALKITDVLYSLQSSEAIGTANDRIQRYMRSLALFAGSPILGVFEYTHVGKHSTLLDGFARWGGVFGAILTYLVIFAQMKALRAFSSASGGAGAAIGSLVAVLLVFGLNKHFMSAGITIFIVYPLVFHLLSDSRTMDKPALERSRRRP